MRLLPATIWSVIVALILVLPPLLWRSDADVLDELAVAFVAAWITATFAPQLARISTENETRRP